MFCGHVSSNKQYINDNGRTTHALAPTMDITIALFTVQVCNLGFCGKLIIHTVSVQPCKVHVYVRTTVKKKGLF